MERNRFTSFIYKGTLLFQELFQNELEVAESQLLEARLEELTLRGENVQLLIIPNNASRTIQFHKGYVESLKQKVILSIEYLTKTNIYEKRLKQEKIIAELGDPTRFTGDNVAELMTIVDHYNHFFKPFIVPSLSDFNFLRILKYYYGSAIEALFKDAELERYRVSHRRSMLYPRRFKLTIFNPNPGRPVVSLNDLRIVFTNETYIISNYRHYRVNQKKQSWYSDMDTTLEHTAVNLNLKEDVLYEFQALGIDDDRFLWTDFRYGDTITPIFNNRVIGQTALDPTINSNTLLFKLLFYLFNSSILEINPTINIGVSKIQFVNASWNIQQYIVNYVLTNLVHSYMNWYEFITITSNADGNLRLVNPKSKNVENIITNIVNAINDAVDILEEPDFMD